MLFLCNIRAHILSDSERKIFHLIDNSAIYGQKSIRFKDSALIINLGYHRLNRDFIIDRQYLALGIPIHAVDSGPYFRRRIALFPAHPANAPKRIPLAIA